MTEQLFLIFVAAMGGVAVAVQAQLMGLMDRGIGTTISVCLGRACAPLILAVFWEYPFCFWALG